jgi:hypothetical protein
LARQILSQIFSTYFNTRIFAKTKKGISLNFCETEVFRVLPMPDAEAGYAGVGVTRLAGVYPLSHPPPRPQKELLLRLVELLLRLELLLLAAIQGLKLLGHVSGKEFIVVGEVVMQCLALMLLLMAIVQLLMDRIELLLLLGL